MSAKRILKLEPLISDAFLPFGQVLETEGLNPESINFGQTRKFGNLADVSLGDGGQTQLSIYRSRAIDLPFGVRLMERHPLGSQAFYPLHVRPFPVIVAATDSVPRFADLRVFMTNGRQGVNIFPGTWHHYQLTLGQSSEYLVIDRGGQGDNYEEAWLEDGVVLQI